MTGADVSASVQAWNDRYRASPGFLFGKTPNAWLQAQAGRWAAGARVLCVADGEGRNSVWLARQGLAVSAFDPSVVAVQRARMLAAEAGVVVDHQMADSEGYVWPTASLDGVAAIFIQFAQPALRERLFRQMVDSLRPSGLLMLLGYTPAQLAYKTGGPSQVDQFYTPDLLEAAFADLDLPSLDSFEVDIDEGEGHRGRSALIGLVARRPG